MAKKAEANVASMVKKNFFDAYDPTSSCSKPRSRKEKELVHEEKVTLESMYETMKSLTSYTIYQRNSKD